MANRPVKLLSDDGFGQGNKNSWRKNQLPEVEALWSDVNANVLLAAIDAASRAGAAVMFSRTSDGGAFSILVLHKDQKLREYPHGAQECEHVLRELVEYFQA